MNIFKKIRVEVAAAVSLGVLALGYVAAPAQASNEFGFSVPEISSAVAAKTARITRQIGEQVASEIKETFAQMMSAPRLVRSARTASVFITESNAVLVEATRLPPLDTAVADVDTTGVDTAKSSIRAAL
jgi:hypothetical protein